MEPLAVDVREAARLTSLSPHTIRAYVRSGRMLAVRIGRRVLIEPREIKRLIDEGRDYERTIGARAARTMNPDGAEGGRSTSLV